MKYWQEVELGKMGKNVRKSYKYNKEDDIPYIGYEHIDQQTLSLLRVGNSKQIQSDKKWFHSGDILFGTLRPYFRKVVRVNFQGVCSTDLSVISANEGFDQKFLFYILASQALIDYADITSNGTKMPRAKWEILGKTIWKVPTYVVQKQIGFILSVYDDLIELNNQKIKVLEETARELYKEWFVRMRFPGYKETKFNKGIPDGWGVEKLGRVLEFAYGKSLTEEERIDGEIPVYGSSGVVGKHNKSLVKGPGIVIGRKGNVGSVHWVDKEFYPIDTVFYVVSKISLYYLFYNLENQNFIEADSAVPGLSRNQAYTNYILIPQSDVIEKFNRIITPIFELIENLKEQNTQGQQIRDRLLPRLISGKLQIKDIGKIIENGQD